MLEAMNLNISTTCATDRVGESFTSMPRSQVSGFRSELGFLVRCGLVTGGGLGGEVGGGEHVGEAV